MTVLPMLLEGSIFGKYRIIRQLGRGGMGVVYLAEDTMLAREIALKILDRSMTADESFEDRFRQEARTIAHLKHPSIIQVHALERIGGELAIEMEYIEGGALSEVILEQEQAIQVLHDTLEALACCHAMGIVHRDVKPSNILLTQSLQPLLTDFGLSKLLGAYHSSVMANVSSSALFVGTPRYAPPEAWDSHETSPRWDVYSMGMVMYEEFARRTPYNADTPFGLIKQILEKPIAPLHEVADGVSPELSALVASMLSLDPALRPVDAGEALERFRKCPEATAALCAERSTIIRKRPLLPTPRSESKSLLPSPSNTNKLRRTTRFALGALCIALALCAAFVAFSALRKNSVLQMPGAALPEGPFGVFNTIEPARQQIWSEHWLMQPGDTPDTYRILAAQNLHLWSINAETVDDDLLRFSGNWAEYSDSTARSFRYGSLSGAGRWIVPNQELSVALEFVSSLDGARREASYMLKRSPTNMGTADFLRILEESPHFPAILYNELLPRQLYWAMEVERYFAAAFGAPITLPRLNKDSAPPTIDGRLDEPCWHVSGLDSPEAQGLLQQSVAEKSAKIMLRYDSKGLYIGCQINSPLGNERISLGLLTHYRTPATDSPRWMVQIDQGVIQASRHIRRGQRMPWDCAWLSAFSVRRSNTDPSSPLFETEIFIPFSNLEDTQAPKPGERWRFNCQLASLKTLGGMPFIHWGSENINALEHGIMLVFG